MTNQQQIFGLIERDLTRDVFVGKIIGFPHIEFEAANFVDVVGKLQAHSVQLVGSESLILESEFIGIFRL